MIKPIPISKSITPCISSRNNHHAFLFLLFTIHFSFLTVSAQFPVLKFQRFYGTSGKDIPTKMIIGPDSALYLGGQIISKEKEHFTDPYFMKIMPDGEPIWNKHLAGKGYDEVRDMCANDDETFSFTGVSGQSYKHFEKGELSEHADILFGKISSSGALMFQKTYGGSDQDFGSGIQSTNYGGNVVVGGTWSSDFDATNNPNTLNNLWITIYNKNGELLRDVYYGGTKNDWASAICKAKDGGFIISGFTNSENMDNSTKKLNGDAMIIKTDFMGSKQWIRVLKEEYDDHLVNVKEAKFGYIYACGSSFVENMGRQFWLTKLDPTGVVLFSKKWGGTGHEHLSNFVITEDGGIIATGYSFYENLENEYIKGQYDLWVIRMDAYGNIIWQKTYGGPGNEKGIDIVEYTPGVFYVLGQKYNTFEKEGDKQEDFWVLKIEEMSCDEVKPIFSMDIVNDEEKLGVPIKFTNKSNLGERWLWNFGDGTTSQERDVIKSYTKPGFFYVSLTVFVNENCYKVYTYPKYITIY